MATMSPKTVTVFYNAHLGYWVWRCSCGKRTGSYRDERQCRDDGLTHQQSHLAAVR